MIAGLYKIFDHWHAQGTLWIYSDPHFNDSDLKAGIVRPDAEELVKLINSKVGRKDTIIILGDIVDIEPVKKIRGYSKMTPKEQASLKLPYIQTSLMVNELINLEHEIKGTNIKISEKSGMRKDRYSTLMMNNKICQELAIRLKPKNTDTANVISQLLIKQPTRTSSMRRTI